MSTMRISMSKCYPDVGHEAGTTASEFDGALDEPEDEDKAVKAINVDELDEDLEPQRKKKLKKVCSCLLMIYCTSY
jgi:hypothetical protein